MSLPILNTLVAAFAYCGIKVIANWSLVTQQHCRLPLWCQIVHVQGYMLDC